VDTVEGKGKGDDLFSRRGSRRGVRVNTKGKKYGTTISNGSKRANLLIDRPKRRKPEASSSRV